MIYDAIIIGLGASGVSASIYAKRSGLNIAVINLSVPGGIINEATIVENYPGFRTISGMDLAYNFFEHFNSLDIPLFNEEVTDINYGDVKEVITTKNKYYAKNIIICSGRKPRKLDIEDENKFIGRGISYCTLCDGNLYKDKVSGVVGGGNSALESVLYLSNICKKVYLFVRSDKLRGDKVLVEDIVKRSNIEIKYNTIIDKFNIRDDTLFGVKTNNGDYDLNGLFINIGYEPSINIVKNLDIELDKNYIVVDKNMETNLKGIYACGDIIKKDLYQLVTAVSDGAIAANHIYKNKK